MRKREFIYIFIIVVIAIGAIVLWDSNRDLNRNYRSLESSYHIAIKNSGSPEIPPIAEEKDSVANTSTTVYRPIQTIGPPSGYVSKGLADTMALALKVQAKDIQRLSSIILQLEGKGIGERFTDTISKVQWLVMKDDPVFDIKVNLGNDSIYPAARIRLDQAYAPYRRNVFSKWEYRSVIRASDQRVQILGIRDVNQVPKSSRWGIGLFGGVVATPKGLTYGVGAGINFDLIQSKK